MGRNRELDMKKCVYTVITGDYDTLKDPTYVTPGWDYICFTNNTELRSGIWNVRQINDKEGHSNPRLARKVWILFHKYVPGYDLSVMVGGQIGIIGDLDEAVKILLPKDKSIDLSLAKHPVRECIYQEADKCVSKKRDDSQIINQQMDHYREQGMPKNFGLAGHGIMIRRHLRPNLERHSELCWEEVKKWSYRDQLSFYFVLWKHNLVKLHLFDFGIIRKSNWFNKTRHMGQK